MSIGNPEAVELRCPRCHRPAVASASALFACQDCAILVKPGDAGKHTHNIAGVIIEDSTCPNCEASMFEAFHCECEEVYDEYGAAFTDSAEYTVYQTLWGGILKWLGVRR